MNAGARKLLHGKYSPGTYTVVSSLQEKNKLIEWIKRGEFREFERGQFHILSYGRPSNTLYAFFLPYHPTKLAMKKTTVNFRYRLSRRIEIWFYCLLGIYARRAFVGSCLLHSEGIPVPRPLAYWTFRHGWKKWFITDNYFLYEYQSGETIVNIRGQFAQDNRYADQLHCTCTCKMAAFIKKIHIAGLRHGDAYAGNFLVNAPQGTESLPDIKLVSLCLLDNDKAERAKRWHIRAPAVKHFFDFSDLAKAVPSRYAMVRVETYAMDGGTSRSPLRVYLGREPTGYDRWLLRFWQSGGTSIQQRFRLWRKRGKKHRRGRHLRW